jgi:hypothetical protein
MNLRFSLCLLMAVLWSILLKSKNLLGITVALVRRCPSMVMSFPTENTVCGSAFGFQTTRLFWPC